MFGNDLYVNLPHARCGKLHQTRKTEYGEYNECRKTLKTNIRKSTVPVV
jgi:hypothetical protein